MPCIIQYCVIDSLSMFSVWDWFYYAYLCSSSSGDNCQGQQLRYLNFLLKENSHTVYCLFQVLTKILIVPPIPILIDSGSSLFFYFTPKHIRHSLLIVVYIFNGGIALVVLALVLYFAYTSCKRWYVYFINIVGRLYIDISLAAVAYWLPHPSTTTGSW